MQRSSTKSPDVEQLALTLVRRAPKPPDIAYLASLPNFRRAVRYSMSLADLEPKQVYEPLAKDKATWSRIEGGDMGFPADLIIPFQEITQNDAALMWLVHAAGYDINSLRKRQDDKDKEIEQLKEKLAKANEENSIIAKFVRDNLR